MKADLNNAVIAYMPIDDIIIPKWKKVDQAKVTELAESIRKIGLLNPITITAKKQLIAGLQRLEACRSLAMKEIPVIMKDLSELYKQLAGVDEDLVRKHLSVLEYGELCEKKDAILKQLGRRAQKGDNKHTIKNGAVTTKVLAKNEGRSPRTRQRKVKIWKNLDPKVREQLKDTEVADNMSVLMELSRQAIVIQKKAAEKIRAGMAGKTAIKDAHRDNSIKKLQDAAKNYSVPDNVKLHRDDFRKVCAGIKDDSCDLIITDPLYKREALPDYSDLGKVASRILKPGGYLVAYCGTLYLPEILKSFEEAGLTYHWIGGIFFHSGQIMEMERRVINKFRAVVFFRKPGGSEKNRIFQDMFACEKKEKDYHYYQQNIEPIREWIVGLTRPGDTVLDCFMGTGTTGVAAVQESRAYIGIDIDKKMFATAEARITVEANKFMKIAA